MNPLHELANLIHEFADRVEAVFKKDAPAAEKAAETAGETVLADAEKAAAQVGEETVKAAETAAPAVEKAAGQAASDLK